MFTLRDYQAEAVACGVGFLTGKFKKAQANRHGLMIEPTGCGKSLILANIVKDLNAPSLVFQPSREILRQNFSKLVSYGFRPAVYSASLGKKQISGAVTLATIGSVIKKAQDFEHVNIS
jgi:DNA repair protein RadD